MPLPAASVLFAVLWTAGMLWWNAPLHIAETIILVVAGAVAGFLWYFVMRLFMKRLGGTR
jgi:hypothetical protein